MGFASLLAGIALLLLLLAAAAKGWLTSRGLNEMSIFSEEDAMMEKCAEETVSNIFSRSDWEFVQSLKMGSIEKAFQRERKRVALIWVRQTSAMVQRVMQAHMKAARESTNLEVSTETKILGHFLLLMTVCGILSTAIQVGGPLWLSGLAHFADRQSRRVTQLQQAMQAAVPARSAS
jgi:hypothetical protein